MNMQTRILVADDNAEILEILRILLTGEGYEVIEAKDGNEVLQFCLLYTSPSPRDTR